MRKLSPVWLASCLASAPLALACNDVDLDEDEDPVFADAPPPEDDRPPDDDPVGTAVPTGVDAGQVDAGAAAVAFGLEVEPLDGGAVPVHDGAASAEIRDPP